MFKLHICWKCWYGSLDETYNCILLPVRHKHVTNLNLGMTNFVQTSPDYWER